MTPRCHIVHNMVTSQSPRGNAGAFPSRPKCVAVPNCSTTEQCVIVTMPMCDSAARQVPRTICNPVPKTTCTAVTDVVIDNVCNTRSVQEYVSVPVQTVMVTPVEECHQVDREVRTRAAEKVAHQVCKEVAVAVAPVAVGHHVAPAHVVVEARTPAVAVVAHHGHGLTKVESTLHGASRHGAGANLSTEMRTAS